MIVLKREAPEQEFSRH